MAIASDEPPSAIRLLAAGQRNEVLNASPVYGPCEAVNIPGKGRGLVASANVPANGLLMLEPALAFSASYSGLAAELCRLVEADGGDATLLNQLMSLSCWGRPPCSVPELPESGEAEGFMKRQPRSSSPEEFEAAKGLLPAEEDSAEDFSARLTRHLELVARANAFRSAVDPLGAFAWHALAPQEQRAVAEADPSRMPSPRLSMFLRASLFNHSEASNACWLVAGSMILVRASRVISKGEEILLSYWPDVDAADASELGLLEGFGMTGSSIGDALELTLSAEQREQLAALKRLPAGAATQLAAAGSAGDIAVLFDEVASSLNTELSKAEASLPKNLHAFLEPRFFQAQLSLQQAAILTARGDPDRGAKLEQLALLRMRNALKFYDGAWGKRVLLRLLFTLKGVLRPAPAELLAAYQAGGDEVDGTKKGEAQDFSIQLAKQARLPWVKIKPELERAVEEVFGDAAILSALLSKCGITEVPE